MRAILLVAVMGLVALAGCASDEPAVKADVITPGAWDVAGDTDHILAWAHNAGDKDETVAWSLTGADGALPDGWSATFDPLIAALSPSGTKVGGARGYEYRDWTRTLVTLTLPADQAAGTFDLVLHAGKAQRHIQAVVHADRTHVSGPGSRVDVHYEGRFQDNGELFDDGEFPTTLGSGKTVAGFDYGLMGLAPGETATLVIPPAFGYGYDATGSYAQFNGRTLLFKVTLTSLEG